MLSFLYLTCKEYFQMLETIKQIHVLYFDGFNRWLLGLFYDRVLYYFTKHTQTRYCIFRITSTVCQCVNEFCFDVYFAKQFDWFHQRSSRMSRWQLLCYSHWNEEHIDNLPHKSSFSYQIKYKWISFVELRSSCGKNGLLNVDFNVKRQPFVS